MIRKTLFILLFCGVSIFSFAQKKSPAILKSGDYKHYVDYFNHMEDENVVNAIPNAKSWEWMQSNIPLFNCPQDNFEEMYYYRWWSFRKHIISTPQGYGITEFIVKRSYADKYNLISCALGHHIYEGRWLHDQQYVDQDVHLWFRGNDGKPMSKLLKFSSWTADALLNRYYVNMDSKYLLDMYPDLKWEYTSWEDEKKLPNGLFWQFDVRDGMEETISGGRRVKNARPTINSYMYANARALASMAAMLGNKKDEKLYLAKADSIKKLVEEKLWSDNMQFFETLTPADTFANVREAIGFIPWYFNLPSNDNRYNAAWGQVKEEDGFLAPYGLTTAERRHPLFRAHGCCKEKLGKCCTCEWDGAIWPFATSQTMVGMANLLNNYKQDVVDDSTYFRLMELYVESQYHRGRPYIGEYLDEVTGYWLKGDQERSRYYNHSTFADLIITGLMGLRPRSDNMLEINPLIPQDKWDWFCLDNVLYHGKIVTILWDKTGEKYGKGKGFRVMVDGKEVAKSDGIKGVTVKLK